MNCAICHGKGYNYNTQDRGGEPMLYCSCQRGRHLMGYVHRIIEHSYNMGFNHVRDNGTIDDNANKQARVRQDTAAAQL